MFLDFFKRKTGFLFIDLRKPPTPSLRSKIVLSPALRIFLRILTVPSVPESPLMRSQSLYHPLCAQNLQFSLHCPFRPLVMQQSSTAFFYTLSAGGPRFLQESQSFLFQKRSNHLFGKAYNFHL
jgi:hypothetical protein